MTNMFKMMKDAVLAQRNLKKLQDELKRKTVEHAGANGKVNVIARGDASIASIKIDPSLIDPRRADEIGSKVTEAVNGALDEAKKMSASHMQSLMADMGLPNIPGL